MIKSKFKKIMEFRYNNRLIWGNYLKTNYQKMQKFLTGKIVLRKVMKKALNKFSMNLTKIK